MGSSGYGTPTPTPCGTDVEPRGAVDVPAVSSLAPASKIKKNCFRNWLEKVTDFLNIFDPPRYVRPSVWCQPACGFVLTLMYLVGVIFIIVIYTTFSNDGRPLVVRIKYVPWGKILDNSMKDYFCTCELPPEVQTYRKDDPDTQTSSRRQHLYRCYSEDELEDIDVLQFGDDTLVRDIINNTNSGKTPYPKSFTSINTVRWKSYELTSRTGDLFDLHSDPIPSLSQKLEEHGYVGTDGFILLSDLAHSPFFTVPQGFIRAEVNYNCSSCTNCRDLWAKYGASQAAPELNSFSWGNDDGWIFCYQTSGDPVRNDGVCHGACRFFPTVHRPWGIAMNNFSVELLSYIPQTDNTTVTVLFRSRLFYAFAEEFRNTTNETYELGFIDIQRDGVLWTEILRAYSDIPLCETENQYCTGTYICQAAAIYDQNEINSETIKAKCLPEVEHEVGGSWDSTDCEASREQLELEFRDKNETRLERLCDPFNCTKLQPSQVAWNENELVGGEIALSRLLYTPSVISRYRPSLCTNNHSQVFVKRDELEPKRLISIHRMNCTNRTNAKVCCMTGQYKNVTDTSSDGWKDYPFTAEEKDAEKNMFACYRFDKESYPKYMYDQFGAVSGNIGSWLLVLSCIFWVITKTNMPASIESRWIPFGHSETSDSSQTEMSEIVTRPDETQGQNDEDDNTSEQNPTKQKTSYQRLPK